MNTKANAAARDLTEGGILKKLIPYALPLVLSNLLQAFYGIADMMIAGHFIGRGGLSAVNNASQIVNLLTSVAIGLGTGGSIIAGQYFGAKDRERQRAASGTLFSFSLLVGAAISILLYIFSRPLLVLLGAPSLDDAAVYLRICAAGMIPVFAYNALSAVLCAVGNSKQPLICITLAAATNVVLDLLFVGGFHMGTAGAALATVISQSLSLALAFAYLKCHSEIMSFSRASLKIKRAMLMPILKVGVPSILQSSIASVSWLTVTSLINGYGVIVSAGNGVSVKIKEFSQLFISAMASATTAMIAQNLGAGKFDRALKTMRAAMGITVAMALCLIAVIQMFAPALIGIFTPDAETVAAGVRNLRIEILGQVFYAMFLIYHALAIGAGHTIFAMSSSFVNCILVRIILAVTLNNAFGLDGLYWALMIAPSASVPLGFLYARSGVWRRNILERKGKSIPCTE